MKSERSTSLWRRTAAVGVLIPLLLAACGDDDEDASTTETTAAPAAGGSSETTTGDAAGPATGEPIIVSSMGTFEGSTNPSFGNVPEVAAATRAYFDRLNEEGGINGRPVEILECNDQANPDLATTCAREAVDAGAVAVLSQWHSANGTTIVPVLEQANVAFINGPLSPPDYTSSISFTIGGASAGSFGAAGMVLVQDFDCDRIGVFAYDIAASQALVGNVTNAVESVGGEVVNFTVNPTASNFAGNVAEVQDSGVTCLMSIIAPNQVVPLVQALQAAGVEAQFGSYAASNTAETYATLSEAGMEGGIVASQYVNPNSDIPEMVQMREDFEAGDVPMTQFTQAAWTMAHLFTLVAGDIEGDITSASFLEAMNAVDGIELGTVPPYSTQNPITAEGFTRIFSPFAYISRIEGGELVEYLEEPIDSTAAFG